MTEVSAAVVDAGLFGWCFTPMLFVLAGRPTPALRHVLCILAVLLGVMLIAVVVPRSLHSRCLTSSPEDAAKRQVDMISRDYYPRYLWNAPERPCPATLLDVGQAIDSAITVEDLADPWGSPLQFYCGDDKLYVWSWGKDITPYTGDDIMSWER